MKNTESHSIDESLLIQYFGGTLFHDQLEEVERWIAASEENKQMATQIYYLHLATDAMKVNDTNIAFEKITRRINRPRTNWRIKLQQIAALLFIPTLSFSLYLMLSSAPVDEYVEVKTNPGTVTSITLSDNTKVWLNSDSYIKYPAKFRGDKRQIELNGEAYFDVTKDENKKFVVATNSNMEIEVLGTEFNVDAYDSNDFVATTLVTGKVKFMYDNGNAQKQELVMVPGQKIIANTSTHTIRSFSTNIEPDIAWKDGKIIFNDTPLEEALNILSKRFNVVFIIKDPKLKQNSFTGAFAHQHLDKILESFRISSNIRSRYVYQEINDEKVIIELY